MDVAFWLVADYSWLRMDLSPMPPSQETLLSLHFSFPSGQVLSDFVRATLHYRAEQKIFQNNLLPIYLF